MDEILSPYLEDLRAATSRCSAAQPTRGAGCATWWWPRSRWSRLTRTPPRSTSPTSTTCRQFDRFAYLKRPAGRQGDLAGGHRRRDRPGRVPPRPRPQDRLPADAGRDLAVGPVVQAHPRLPAEPLRRGLHLPVPGRRRRPGPSRDELTHDSSGHGLHQGMAVSQRASGSTSQSGRFRPPGPCLPSSAAPGRAGSSGR